MPIPLGIFATAGAGGAGGSAFELISTQLISSATSSVTFSSIPATFKHLQIRMVARNATSTGSPDLTFNGDTGFNYATHWLYGTGSSVASAGNAIGDIPNIPLTAHMSGNTADANAFGVGITDILDYANTSKNTTVRSLGGRHQGSSSNFILIRSGFWNNTAAVTSIRIAGNDFAAGSRISLYGIRG